MTQGPTLEALQSAVRSLFPGEVAVGVARVADSQSAELWPEERASIAGAVPARQAEFSAGRTAARQALQALGHRPVALPMEPDRAARWPAGVSGSIAHAAGVAVAVARHGPALGVDVEEDAPLEPEIWSTICSPAELACLPVDDRGRLARSVFSAKEAVFKAQEPISRAVFGFDAVTVALAGHTFEAKVLMDAGSFRLGDVIRGNLAHIQGLILAGVAR
jgi:4'-phosphopantetheinyl transferase EntD